MPCWDCEAMGNMQCAVHPLEVEAWEAIDNAGITNPTPDTYMLSYQGSWVQATSDLPLGWFSVHSDKYSDLVHVFNWERIWSC